MDALVGVVAEVDRDLAEADGPRAERPLAQAVVYVVHVRATKWLGVVVHIHRPHPGDGALEVQLLDVVGLALVQVDGLGVDDGRGVELVELADDLLALGDVDDGDRAVGVVAQRDLVLGDLGRRVEPQPPLGVPIDLSLALEDRALSEDTRLRLSELAGELPKALSGEFDFPVVWNDRVKEKIVFLQTDAREPFSEWLRRSGRYLPMIKNHHLITYHLS